VEIIEQNEEAKEALPTQENFLGAGGTHGCVGAEPLCADLSRRVLSPIKHMLNHCLE